MPQNKKPLSARTRAEINAGWNAGYVFWINHLLDDAMDRLREAHEQRRLEEQARRFQFMFRPPVLL